MERCRLTMPCPPCFQSRKGRSTPGRLHTPGSAMVNSGVRLPADSAASAMNGLIVEPGGYCPRSARLLSGLSGELLSWSQLCGSIPSTNRLGSKPGLETSASTSPVFGSMATSAPR